MSSIVIKLYMSPPSKDLLFFGSNVIISSEVITKYQGGNHKF